ncbi:M15 family metallopeptidase [Leucobacter sp. HY1910]
MRTKILIALLAGSSLLTGCSPQAASVVSETQQAKPDHSVQADTRAALPEGFVYVGEAVPGVQIDARYGTPNNFTGAIVDGYRDGTVAVLRDEAAAALAGAQQELAEAGLGLLVWDAFRPTRAVADFVAWSKTDDESTKAEYYPQLEKAGLFELGYIATQSRHSLGGTVDLTVIDTATGELLDMGGSFDLFSEQSHYAANGLTDEQRANRLILNTVMQNQGFEPFDLEWWHFSYPLDESVKPADFRVE